MALKIKRKGKPTARRVPLDGGVALWVRPAEYPEAMAAAERVAPMIVALREGSEAAIALGELLGEEFAAAVWDDASLAAAAHKLALIELVALCCERIEGELLDEDDRAVVAVDAAIAAALVRDTTIARTLRAVIEGPLHEVVAEKKGLAPSPDGAAARLDTAPDAAKAAPPAQPAAAG